MNCLLFLSSIIIFSAVSKWQLPHILQASTHLYSILIFQGFTHWRLRMLSIPIWHNQFQLSTIKLPIPIFWTLNPVFLLLRTIILMSASHQEWLRDLKGYNSQLPILLIIRHKLKIKKGQRESRTKLWTWFHHQRKWFKWKRGHRIKVQAITVKRCNIINRNYKKISIIKLSNKLNNAKIRTKLK